MIFSFMAPTSVGPILFSMERAHVRTCLGKDFRSFKKTFLSTNTLDAFDAHDVQVYYNDNNRAKGIELFGDSEFRWLDEKLLGESFADLKLFLTAHSIGFDLHSSGVDVDAYGVSFYIPDIGDKGDDSTVESIYIDLSSTDVSPVHQF